MSLCHYISSSGRAVGNFLENCSSPPLPTLAWRRIDGALTVSYALGVSALNLGQIGAHIATGHFPDRSWAVATTYVSVSFVAWVSGKAVYLAGKNAYQALQDRRNAGYVGQIDMTEPSVV